MAVSKHDVHFLDPLLKSTLWNAWFVLIFSIVSVVMGVVLAIHFCDWLWFSRFGSLISVAGLLLVSSPIGDLGVYRAHARSFGFARKDDDGNSQVSTDESKNTGNKVLVGIFVSILGTIVWGFGDLLGGCTV